MLSSDTLQAQMDRYETRTQQLYADVELVVQQYAGDAMMDDRLYEIARRTGQRREIVEAMAQEMCKRTGRPELEVVDILYGKALAIV